jgi:hypothetical protein
MSVRIIFTAAVAATAVIVMVPGGHAAVAAASQLRIGPAVAFRAPIGQKGGITNPVATCPSNGVEARTRWVLTNTHSGTSHTYRWRGALPDLYFPRVPVGHYKSVTTAWCPTSKANRTQFLTVREKTADTTVSKAEFNQIHRGMTTTKVRQIVGYPGVFGFGYSGNTSRTYDMMPFWRWALITYRNGRVVGKMWDVAHD